MKSTLMMLALLFSCFVSTSTARADGFRSYISPSGNDNRPCRRNEPCRTFNGAIAKTDDGGEIIALETSTYDPVTVTKTVTLTAAPGADVVIKATNGNAVTINTPNTANSVVVLRGLKIVGPGREAGTFGVFVDPETAGVGVTVENCLISGFGVGLRALQIDSLQLVVSESVFRHNGTGVMAQSGGVARNGAALTRTRFEHNFIGVAAVDSKPVAVKDCVAVSNTIGFLVEPGGNMTIFDSIVSKNTTGVETRVSGTSTIGNSTVTGNDIGLAAEGQVLSLGNNMVAGNDIANVSGVQNVIIIPAQ